MEEKLNYNDLTSLAAMGDSDTGNEPAPYSLGTLVVATIMYCSLQTITVTLGAISISIGASDLWC